MVPLMAETMVDLLVGFAPASKGNKNTCTILEYDANERNNAYR